MSFTSLPDKNRRFGLSAQQITQIFGCHSPAGIPGCVKNFIFFPCPLDGERFRALSAGFCYAFFFRLDILSSSQFLNSSKVILLSRQSSRF